MLRRSFHTTTVNKLLDMEKYCKSRNTIGLNKSVIDKFRQTDYRLGLAIDSAHKMHCSLRNKYDHILRLPEQNQIKELQENFMNFYKSDYINPYVPLSAYGPWVVTSCGAVIHDNGGYGMLGFGHSPRHVINVMSEDQVMANIMTPNFWQLKFTESLNNEIGRNRIIINKNPFHKYC